MNSTQNARAHYLAGRYSRDEYLARKRYIDAQTRRRIATLLLAASIIPGTGYVYYFIAYPFNPLSVPFVAMYILVCISLIVEILK